MNQEHNELTINGVIYVPKDSIRTAAEKLVEMEYGKEIASVRCALHAVLNAMTGEETRNSEGFYCLMVEHGVLEMAYEVLRRYEKLLAEEPVVEKIADDWRKSGAFLEGPKGVF